MQAKGPRPVDGFRPDEPLGPLVRAYLELNHLKQMFRRGWLQRGLSAAHCETVAEHSFGVAMLAMWLCDAHFPDLDRERVLRMALLHDLGEIHAGDVTPSDGIDDVVKSRREAESLRRTVGGLPSGEVYVELWREYEASESPEARFVRQVDRLEMALQALAYQRGRGLDPSEFLASAEAGVQEEKLRELLDELFRLAEPPRGV